MSTVRKKVNIDVIKFVPGNKMFIYFIKNVHGMNNIILLLIWDPSFPLFFDSLI
jgi:hypothetical protein